VHLAISAVLLAAGMNAEHAEFSQRKAKAEGGKDGCG
jgi:hypothetical protein